MKKKIQERKDKRVLLFLYFVVFSINQFDNIPFVYQRSNPNVPYSDLILSTLRWAVYYFVCLFKLDNT